VSGWSSPAAFAWFSVGFVRRHFEIICSEKRPVLINRLSARVPTIETRPPCHVNRFLTVDQLDPDVCAGTACEIG
jgi:hypothetical protein